MGSRSYLFLLVVLVLAGLSGWLFTAKKANYGLDVRGGIRFNFELDTSRLSPDRMANFEEVRKVVVNVMTERVSKALGVIEGNVQPKGTNQIVVELPGFKDENEARELLSTTAALRWYHAKNVRSRAGTTVVRYDVIDEPKDYMGMPVYRFSPANKPETVIEPGTPEYLKMVQSWEPPILEGTDLQSAGFEPGAAGSYYPTMTFTAEGGRKMAAWCRRVMNQGAQLAAVLDNKVLSIAPLRDNAIIDRNGVIEGKFTAEYVKSLKELLNSGALPVDLKQLASQRIDPTIGAKALEQLMQAGIVAFVVISLFLLVYYMFPGLVALIALGLYILFTLAVLKAIDATFSLAAIAGFILSVGMAVDANILVFERVKEELREGKTLQNAINLGFKRAWSAIVDSNACTILTSLVLWNIGSGPVKGFASTLIIGVGISLFTAVVVTRSLLVFLVGSGLGANPKWYGTGRQWFGEHLEAGADHKPLQIVNNSKRYFMISLLTIIPGAIFIFMGGIKPNVEFQGGFESTYKLSDTSVTSSSILAKLEAAGMKGGNVKIATGSDEVGEGPNTTKQDIRVAIITVPPMKELEGTNEEAQKKIAEAAGFKPEDNRGFQAVGPTIREESIRNAVMGVVVSTALIILYLSFRFGLALGGFVVGLRFALSTIGALLHDVLVVIGLAAILGYVMGWEVSALFITSMLTVIGFSTHDTIVIFDRIRENLRRPHPNEDIGNLMNRSITQSIARSINTSSTVIVTLLLLIFIGSATPELQFFNAAMLFGIMSGTYSSIYNASPILYLWDKAVTKKRGPHAGLMGMSAEQQARDRIMNSQVATPAQKVEPGQSDVRQSYGQTKRRVRNDRGSHEID